MKKTITFIQFKTMVGNQFNKRIRIIQCDCFGEHKVVQKHDIEEEMKIMISFIYTSHQNDMGERNHKHIVEFGLPLLAQEKCH